MTRDELLKRLERHDHAHALVAAALDVGHDHVRALRDTLTAKALVGPRRGRSTLDAEEQNAVRALLAELDEAGGAP